MFVLLIGIPIAIEFFTVGFIFTADDVSSGLERFLHIFPILMLLYIGVSRAVSVLRLVGPPALAQAAGVPVGSASGSK